MKKQMQEANKKFSAVAAPLSLMVSLSCSLSVNGNPMYTSLKPKSREPKIQIESKAVTTLIKKDKQMTPSKIPLCCMKSSMSVRSSESGISKKSP